MKLENEEALDHLVICHKCHTLHKEIPLEDGSRANCSECNALLYRYDTRLIDYGLALSITALIFFAVANFFPVVKIELLGHEQFITISKTFLSLIDNGFYFVGVFCAFLVFIFPLTTFVLYLTLFTLFKLKRGREISREILVLLSHMKPWNMSDIFLVSVLVALVKLIGYAQIHIGTAFWALILFVLVDIYVNKSTKLSEIWMLRQQLFEEGR